MPSLPPPSQSRRAPHVGTRGIAALVATLAITGCAGGADRSDAGADAGEPCPGSVCLSRSFTLSQAVDVLFVVDDSPTMAGAQTWLREWLPALTRTLIEGRRENPDGSTRGGPPVRSMHIGIVSADMGLAGVTGSVTGVSGCEGTGDDGRLRHRPVAAGAGCATAYPAFLRYNEGDDEDAVLRDVACMSALGRSGCDVPQPLEATLKALWPPVGAEPDPSFGDGLPRFPRLPEYPTPQGHGDGYNAGFLRSDASIERSLAAVIVVTNRDDCSTPDPAFLTPADQLSADDPLRAQHPSMRCIQNESRLYSVDRYLSGLQQLRGGDRTMLYFGAIVGVPPDLVQTHDAHGNALVDLHDASQRKLWYAKLLDDPRMQARVDDGDPDPAKHALLPSCTGTDGGSGIVAYPPRRLVALTRDLTYAGALRSICDADPRPVLDPLLYTNEPSVDWTCMEAAQQPDDDGLVPCEVRWELPPAGRTAELTPSRCDQRPFLAEPTDGSATRTDRGGAICIVRQLPAPPRTLRDEALRGDDAAKQRAVDAVEQAGDGWYYDDFSWELVSRCWERDVARIGFTSAVSAPPPGVTVRVQCE